MSRHVDFLPLGSVVRMKGTKAEDYVILQRCVHTKPTGQDFQLFDYGGVFYPEGLTNHELYYFNSDKVGKVLFKGYSDDDDKKLVKSINEYLEKDDYKLSFWDKFSTIFKSLG